MEREGGEGQREWMLCVCRERPVGYTRTTWGTEGEVHSELTLWGGGDGV